MPGSCEECHKGFTEAKLLGTRRYCPHCGAYLGTSKKAEEPYLPSTWWRTRTGGHKTVKTPERPEVNG
jgi:hypothetical protein